MVQVLVGVPVLAVLMPHAINAVALEKCDPRDVPGYMPGVMVVIQE